MDMRFEKLTLILRNVTQKPHNIIHVHQKAMQHKTKLLSS